MNSCAELTVHFMYPRLGFHKHAGPQSSVTEFGGVRCAHKDPLKKNLRSYIQNKAVFNMANLIYFLWWERMELVIPDFFFLAQTWEKEKRKKKRKCQLRNSVSPRSPLGRALVILELWSVLCVRSYMRTCLFREV